jgi:pSer/pThr/pTyr-binding forkhead associated (FHA) protein
VRKPLPRPIGETEPVDGLQHSFPQRFHQVIHSVYEVLSRERMALKEQHMAPQDNRSRSNETSAAETTAALPDELDESTSTSADEAVAALEELPGGSALLVVTRGPSAGARFLLDRDFMEAGRHPDSDIFLDDITVSRRHAEFRRETGKFRIVDAGSLNGTYINRQPVDSAVLANRDEIQIGKFRLVFFTAP